MGLFNNWRGIRGIVQLLMIQLLCWLAWSVSVCLAQFDISEGLTGSVNFPSSLAITCVGNLAVFVTSLIRGRLDLEIGARDVLAILRGRKLRSINLGKGLTTCEPRRINYTHEYFDLSKASVVMLSNGKPNSSIRQFTQCNTHIVDSMLLEFLPLGDAVVTIEACECNCKCILFWTSDEITVMLARRIPGTLKQLSDFMCLLPCLTCLKNGCHGCNNGLLYAEEGDRLREGNSIVQSPAKPHVVCKILEDIDAGISNRAGGNICVCIPLKDSRHDDWAELLIRSFRSKDVEGRGVRVMASEALESYLAGGTGVEEGKVEYNIASFLLPRLSEALINIVLTVFFTVDGLSSSLVARRAIRDYIVDSKGTGFAANAFLTKALVRCDGDSTCQLLTFRGNVLSIRTIAIAVGCVNMGCSIVWAVLIAFDDGADTSPSPSMAIVAVIIAAIGIALAMDFAMCWAAMSSRWTEYLEDCFNGVIAFFCPFFIPCCLVNRCYVLLLFTMIYLEIVCLLSCSILLGTVGIKAFGKWIYSGLQTLVLLKWLIGSALLDSGVWKNVFGIIAFSGGETEFYGGTPPTWAPLTYSSAFLLNAFLAGVRARWGNWEWKVGHLWSRKLLS